MNWGGFAGGFSQGFNNGVAMGKTVSQLIKEDKLQKIREQGIAEARARQEADVANSVRENGIDSGTPATPATAQASPAPSAPKAFPVAEDPMTADQGKAPAAPAPVDSSLEGAPAPTRATPAPTSTPQATPAPKEPAVAPASQAADGIAPPPARFTVNGKPFATREEAMKYAKGNAAPVMNYMTETLVPKMQEEYLAQGDVEKAEAWGKWAKDAKNERHMESWAKAFTAYQSGDFVTSAQQLVKMHADLPDGNTVEAAEPVKDKAGNVTGFNMKIKNDATGETRAQFVDPKTLTEFGLGALSPDKMFSAVFQRQTQADTLAAKAKIDEANDARTERRELKKQEYIETRADKRAEAADRRAAAKDERQHGYKLEELTTKETLERAGFGTKKRAELQAEIDIAKENGATDEEIKSMVRHRVGGDAYKKTTDPTERRALVVSDLMKNDPTFARAPQEEKNKRVESAMQLIYQEEGKPAGAEAKPGAGLAVGAPAPANLPDGAYKDQATGQPFRVKGGKIVPLK